MSITFELPSELERSLRASVSNLDAFAKEAALVELYRLGKISAVELRHSLGLARVELDALLKRYAVVEDLDTTEEHEALLARIAAANS